MTILELKLDIPFILIGDYNLYYIQQNVLAKILTREAKE